MAWLTAEEAMARLGVRAQTLYAYVSRGRIEARPDPADPRRSLYDAEAVARLAARRTGPRRAADVAQGSIDWGEPVLASSLTCVSDGRLFYRGRDAAALAQDATLEQAAAWFWDAREPSAPPIGRDEIPLAATARARLFAALGVRAADDAFARGRSRAALVQEAADLLNVLGSAAAGAHFPGPIHLRLASAWGLSSAHADLLRCALVLLLDHELNPSTFAARVAASTGGPLAAAALAGLSTLAGPLHGSAADAVLGFLAEAERRGADLAVRSRLDEGRPVPGFGHPLYPAGDPRAAALIAALGASQSVRAVQEAVARETGMAPNIDFAIAALALQANLPPDAPFAIFAVGRSVGWFGHAIEQIESGALIRPRARYVGPPLNA